MLDIWGHHKGTYGGRCRQARELKDNGVDHIVIIRTTGTLRLST